MKIYHAESGGTYEITEEKESFKLLDFKNNKSYSFKESYEAIWFAIELIRSASFDLLTEEKLVYILGLSKIQLSGPPKSLLQQLKKEKISHTYYDQAFLKLLTSYRSGHAEISVSNQTYFDIKHELQHLLRKLLGTKLTIPSVKA